MKIAGLSAAQLAVFKNIGHAVDDPALLRERRSLQKATRFINIVSRYSPRGIKSITLLYDVHMMADLYVKLKMNAALTFGRENNHYYSTFSLTEPESEGGWSWLVFNLFGKHTSEYKEMMKNIEVRLIESIHLWENKLYTDKLEELHSKNLEDSTQPAMKIDFNYQEMLIKFWSDKKLKQHDMEIKYINQTAPLTAFFNYIFYEPTETKLNVINALKQEETQINKTPSGNKSYNFIFQSEPVKIERNPTDEFMEFPMSVHLEKSNFLDVIYGDYIYYKLVRGSETNIKVPYTAHIEGIISKKKKREKIKELRQKYTNEVLFEKKLRESYRDILASTDVQVYLAEFEIIR